MKKAIGIVLVSFAVLTIIGIIAVNMFFNSAIKKGIETFGPKVTQTSVSLDSVNISPLSGYGEIHGLVIGNADGFNTPSAFSLDKVIVHVDLKSLMTDKIIIKEILIDGPEVTYEMALTGSNLDQLKKNVESLTAAGSSGQDRKTEKKHEVEPSGEGKKIQIDSFVFENATVNLSAKILQGAVVPISLPKIHLTDIGKESDGSSISEILDEVFGSIFTGITDTVKTSGKLGGTIGDSASMVSDAAKDGASKVIGGVKGLFKKK